MTNTIRIRAQHASSESTFADVRDVDANGDREISPESAVTIASWWQSPGSVGSVLAGLASGVEVNRTSLLDDIAATRRMHGYDDETMDYPDRLALDCLATFVINYA